MSLPEIFNIVRQVEVEFHLARLALYHSAWLRSENLPCFNETCMAKLYATEVANRMALRVIEIFGGYGYMIDSDIPRYVVDSFVPLIGGGTRQIQKNMIARALGL